MDTRFFRWFRTIPLLLMAVCVALSLAAGLVPDDLVREWFYPVRYPTYVQESADRHGVDPYLVCAVIKCESDWRSDAQSQAGAVGLMQLMPATSKEVARLGLVDTGTYDPADLTDPRTNIEYGTAYLAYLQANLSSRDEVVAAYNAGLGSVQAWTADGSDVGSSIQYAETATYLARVNAAYDRYRGLYPSSLG